MGDVMGHGPGTAGRAATVLRAWRDLAAHEETLEGVAVRLHSLIASSAEPDRFVTATLVGIRPDGTGDLVCCGHPPPLLMRGRSAVCAAVPAPAPPLGLLDLDDGWCAAGCIPAGAWDRLLLYTDGVSDATDAAGTAYPLAECAAPLVDRPLDAFVEEVATDLLRHAGGRLRDDASLLAAELDGRPRGR
ncbi:PP2C family protein-serine/threonine phosphatase [Streptomyces sp. NPDC050504]|uniref:PP2C family protein-serine/threonine phosphatase n=1 Tax=Streptomyces sp. NPDC050504 TaxID=3365618 RepID=UPI00378C5770